MTGETQEVIDQRRQLWDQGLTDTEIAKKMGVTPAAIYSWRTRKRLPSNHAFKGNGYPTRIRKHMLKRARYMCGECVCVGAHEGYYYCIKLKEMIGQVRECPFYEDDPGWREKAEAAIRKRR